VLLLDFLSIFVVVEIHWPNAMVDDDNNQLEVNWLFVLGCSTYLKLGKIGQDCASGLKVQETPKNWSSVGNLD
jgi:hypothetical protein